MQTSMKRSVLMWLVTGIVYIGVEIAGTSKSNFLVYHHDGHPFCGSVIQNGHFDQSISCSVFPMYSILFVNSIKI